jgi:hypothetical protein
LLSIFLYFTGWIYRLAYFDFFQLKVTNLVFPVESFFFVPMQVFFRDLGRCSLTILVLTATIFIIRFILWLVNKFFPAQICKDFIIVVLLLSIIYWYARSQGYIDARQEAINSTSHLPTVTVITKNEIGLGRNLKDIFTDPNLENYHIFGDKALFDSLKGKEINDSNQNRVWRLLIQSNGWIYIFPSLSDNPKPDERPPVLAIRESSNSDQIMILSPQPVREN